MTTSLLYFIHTHTLRGGKVSVATITNNTIPIYTRVRVIWRPGESSPIIFHPVLLSLAEMECERTLHHSTSTTTIIIIIYLDGVRRRGVRTHQTLLCSWKGREETTCRFSQISSADGFSQGELTQFAWAFITGTTRSRLTKQCKCSLFMSGVEELFNCSQCSADITWAFWKEQKDLCHNDKNLLKSVVLSFWVMLH